MHPVVIRLACLALFAGVLALMAQESEAVNAKVSDCCKLVSTLTINVPISGFRYQKKDPPCVKAIIFITTEGERCVHWRMNWVKAKVQELQKANKNSTTAAPTTQ